MDNFKGYTMAAICMLRWAEILASTLKTNDLKNTNKVYTTEVKIFSKTDSLLIEYSTHTSCFFNEKQGRVVQDNPGLVRNLNSDMKAFKKASSVLFLLLTIWWMDAVKRIEKIIRENAFEQKKKKPRLKFNPGLALIGLRTTGPGR